MATKLNTIKLAICGPNLRDQTKGQFHVHAAGCADLKRTNAEPAYKDAWVIDAADERDVTFAVYADHIAERYYEVEDIDTLGDDDIAAYSEDFHYFPCVHFPHDEKPTKTNKAPKARKEATMATQEKQFVKVEDKQGKKYSQVAAMIQALRDAKGTPIPFEQLCEDAGVKYSQDVQAAMFALELVGQVDRYSFVEDGSTRKHTAYAITADPTPAASTGSKRRSSKTTTPKATPKA